MEKVFVVQSRINLSVTDTETCFAVIGVADNKERAKEMLKEEVASYFNVFNERFCDSEDEEEWGYDHELDINSKKDFPDDEYYIMDDYKLDVFCEVNIIEKTINA